MSLKRLHDREARTKHRGESFKAFVSASFNSAEEKMIDHY
jgi:hypothetical protein